MCINAPNGSQFNISLIKRNSIIYIPKYLSTSMHTSYGYDAFFKNNSFVMKIKINKLSKKWIVLDKYSQYPHEKEILIGRDCYFVTLNVTSQPIFLNGHLIDTTVIELLLCDDFKSAVTESKEQYVKPFQITEMVDTESNYSVIKFINMHDRQIEDMIRALINYEKNVKGGFFKDNLYYLENIQSLLFDNTTKFNRENDNLLYDTITYNNLLKIIYSEPNSDAYKTINKTIQTPYKLNLNKNLNPITFNDILASSIVAGGCRHVII